MTGNPFLFDNHIFDDDPLAGLDKKDIPQFTEADMKSAKENAFQEGKRAGFEESEAAINSATLTALQKIERDMAVLFAAEDDRHKKYEEETIQLAYSIVRKLFPVYAEKFGEEELETAIRSALADHNTPEKVKIELHEDMLKSLETRIKELGETLEKQIILVANPGFQRNECHILWPDGGIICNRDIMAEKTLGIMKEALADRGISVHDDNIDEEQENSDALSDETPQQSDNSDIDNTAGDA